MSVEVVSVVKGCWALWICTFLRTLQKGWILLGQGTRQIWEFLNSTTKSPSVSLMILVHSFMYAWDHYMLAMCETKLPFVLERRSEASCLATTLRLGPCLP